jgi:hypothetical protein
LLCKEKEKWKSLLKNPLSFLSTFAVAAIAWAGDCLQRTFFYTRIINLLIFNAVFKWAFHDEEWIVMNEWWVVAVAAADFE